MNPMNYSSTVTLGNIIVAVPVMIGILALAVMWGSYKAELDNLTTVPNRTTVLEQQEIMLNIQYQGISQSLTRIEDKLDHKQDRTDLH